METSIVEKKDSNNMEIHTVKIKKQSFLIHDLTFCLSFQKQL